MTVISIEPFTLAHLDGLIALVAAEGWTEYADDVERTRRALTAPGVTLVAIAGGHLVGAISVESDGLIQAHVSMLLIARNSRGVGLGSRLLRHGLERAGGLQLDVRTRTRGTTSGLVRAARSVSASRARISASMARTPKRSPAPNCGSGRECFHFRAQASASTEPGSLSRRTRSNSEGCPTPPSPGGFRSTALGRECAHLLSRGDANLAPIGRAPRLARGNRASLVTIAHGGLLAGLDRRWERATIAWPCAEGPRKTSSSQRW
jgi:GNAT superfamily N-acetyltransferase